MRICIITQTFPKNINDGTAAFMHSLALGLKKAGNEIVVVAPYTQGTRFKTFPYKIVTYKYIWPEKYHILGYSNTLKNGTQLRFGAYILSPLLFLFGIIKVIQTVRKEKFDIISAHWILPNGFIAYIARKVLNVPIAVTLPGSDVYIAQKNILFRYMAKKTATNVNGIIADSPRFVDKLLELHPKLKQKTIIPYPVNSSLYKPSRQNVSKLKKKLGLSEKHMVILAVGRFVYKKGFQYLIKAMPAVIKSYPNAKLVLVGDGDLKEEFKALAYKLSIERSVVFTGNIQRDELVTYYNLADIFVMPSVEDKEGNVDDQPVALIEAMACGKPVIATNFPGIALTVQDGKNGILVKQKKANLISSSLLSLLSSKTRRLEMGKKSREIVKKSLTVEKIGEQYTKFFNEVINKYEKSSI